MPLTWKGSEVASAIKTFLDGIKGDLGLKEVYYGDQQALPMTPAACVEPGEVVRELAGAPLQMQNNLTIVVMVYMSGLGSIEDLQLACDTKTEDIADRINTFSSPATLVPGGTAVNGLVVQGWTSSIEYGYAMRGNVLMRANRISWQGLTKTSLVLS